MIPKTRRERSSEKGGMTAITDLLTTYIAPHIELAVMPEIMPSVMFFMQCPLTDWNQIISLNQKSHSENLSTKWDF